MQSEYEQQREKNQLSNDILYALKIFDINSKTINQKIFGSQLLPFVRLFETTQAESQVFCFDLIPKHTYVRFCQDLQAMLLDFEQLQTDHTKKEFAKTLIQLATNLD